MQDWSLTNRVFCVIFRTLVVGVGISSLCRDSVDVFTAPATGLLIIRNANFYTTTKKYVRTEFKQVIYVIYWPLTEPSIKRCTRVNKWKNKRKQVGVMKKYRQVPTAVELVRQEGLSEGQLADWWLWPSATTSWATPAKMRKKCCYGHEKKLGQYSSLSLSPLISHTPQKHRE